MACRFTLATSIDLAVQIAKAEYLTSYPHADLVPPPAPTASRASGCSSRSGPPPEWRTSQPTEQVRQAPELRFSSCRVDSLRFHIARAEFDSVALYEQLFAHCRGVHFRILDSFGDPLYAAGRREMLQQIGFGGRGADSK